MKRYTRSETLCYVLSIFMCISLGNSEQTTQCPIYKHDGKEDTNSIEWTNILDCFDISAKTLMYIKYMVTLIIIIKITSMIYAHTILYLAYKLRGRPIMIGVEGLIGAGKTTFIKGLQNTGFTVIEEPVNIWQDMTIDLPKKRFDQITESERNIMQCYNNEPSKYGYVFQSMVFITKVHNIITNWHKSSLVIVERSPLCDKNVFATMLYNNKIINNTEWLTYNHWYYKMMQTYDVYPDALIYLKVSVQQAINRVRKIGRAEECNVVDNKYLEDLHLLHEEWLVNDSLIIDWADNDTPTKKAQVYHDKINSLAITIATRIVINRILDF